MDKLTFFLKELLESWRCKLELDVWEWRGWEKGAGVWKIAWKGIRIPLEKRRRGGAPGEKDRQTEWSDTVESQFGPES